MEVTGSRYGTHVAAYTDIEISESPLKGMQVGPYHQRAFEVEVTQNCKHFWCQLLSAHTEGHKAIEVRFSHK